MGSNYMESNQNKRIQITKPPQFLTGTAEVFSSAFQCSLHLSFKT